MSSGRRGPTNGSTNVCSSAYGIEPIRSATGEGPDSPLTLQNSDVDGNALSAGSGLTVQGGGIFTPGFPVTLDHSVVAHNAPDDCFGC